MSSEPRSNSAVRNLRSLFENKSSDASDPRGRSPSSTGDLDNSRPRSKIRSSFISVEPTMSVFAVDQSAAGAAVSREGSARGRDASFGDGRDPNAADVAKKTAHGEQLRRNNDSGVADTVTGATVEFSTPPVDSTKVFGTHPPVQKEGKPAATPDKNVTGAEEEPAKMEPTIPADAAVASGSAALPPSAQEPRKPASNAVSSKSTAKPSTISTKNTPSTISTMNTPMPLTSPVKSPARQPGTPTSIKSPSRKNTTKKTSPTSLAAPAAAPVARTSHGDTSTSAMKQSSPATKPKPREATKPIDVPSRLTAPTAASRARLESSASTTGNSKPLTTGNSKPSTVSTASANNTSHASSRQKATAATKPTSRSSLARPESRSSQPTSKRPVAPVDGGFLERMTRPTAASANRSHEKVEAKTPPRQKQLPIRSKVNGQSKAAKIDAAAVRDQPYDEPERKPESELATEPAAAAVLSDESLLSGHEHDYPTDKSFPVNETGVVSSKSGMQTNGLHEDQSALESTSLAQGEEQVR